MTTFGFKFPGEPIETLEVEDPILKLEQETLFVGDRILELEGELELELELKLTEENFLRQEIPESEGSKKRDFIQDDEDDDTDTLSIQYSCYKPSNPYL